MEHQNKDNTSERNAVDEIIEQERLDEERSAIRSGCCPVCWTELDQWENEIDDDLLEITRFCPRCGWESDPIYE